MNSFLLISPDQGEALNQFFLVKVDYRSRPIFFLSFKKSCQ
ncbi:hypothetical protein QUA52_14540 [Microcoleus sp. N9_A3]